MTQQTRHRLSDEKPGPVYIQPGCVMWVKGCFWTNYALGKIHRTLMTPTDQYQITYTQTPLVPVERHFIEPENQLAND